MIPFFTDEERRATITSVRESMRLSGIVMSDEEVERILNEVLAETPVKILVDDLGEMEPLIDPETMPEAWGSREESAAEDLQILREMAPLRREANRLGMGDDDSWDDEEVDDTPTDGTCSRNR